jgi:hypothetical protein
VSYPIPTSEGHFWAKLRLCDNPDHRSVNWEVVQVFDNILRPWCEADIEGGECMMASVPGVEGAHPLDAFVWGPAVHMPAELSQR